MYSSVKAAGDWPAALIFDLDGTLIDSVPDIATAVQRALAAFGVTTDAAEVRDYIGDGAARLIERVLAARGLATPDEAALAQYVADFNAYYHATPAARTQCYDGAHNMLRQARRAGHKIGLCTNKPQAVAERVLAELDLLDAFDVWVGAGTYALKPDPEPLNVCLDQLGVAPADALYIGDMSVDRDVARAAGVAVVLVSFGYAHDDVAHFGPEGVLHAWADWPDLLARLARARQDASS